jgi:hypothetical protein
LFRGHADSVQQLLPGLEASLRPQKVHLDAQWDDAAAREKRSRTMFAQETIAGMMEDVSRELQEIRAAVGASDDVASLTVDGLRTHGAVITHKGKHVRIDLTAVPTVLRDVLEHHEVFTAGFELPVEPGVLYLNRTHPIVEGLATHIMDTALDPLTEGVARRAGAIRTTAVTRRTTLLLVRFRYDIVTRWEAREQSQLAEECRVLAFAGPPTTPDWLDDAAAEALLTAEPEANIHAEQASGFVQRVVDGFKALQPHLEREAHRRAEALREAHCRVRTAARLRGVHDAVKPQLPLDVLGVYVYLPVVAEGARV